MRSLNLKFAATTLCLVSAVGLVLAQNASDHDASWKAPAAAASKKNPVANDPSAVDAGKLAFSRSCSACHGETGDARVAGASNLRSTAVQAQSDGALEWKITNGNISKGMPAFGSLPQEKRWQIVRYIRSLRSAKATTSH